MSYEFELDPRKIWLRAITAQNKEFENVDWKEIKFKLNPVKNKEYVSLSLRPRTKMKYNEGCSFLYRKKHIKDYLKHAGESLNVSGWSGNANIRDSVKQLSRNLVGSAMDIFDQNSLTAKMLSGDVEWLEDTDFQLNVYIVRNIEEGLPVDIVSETSTLKLKDIIGYYLYVDAGENHPIFRGSAHFKIEGKTA